MGSAHAQTARNYGYTFTTPGNLATDVASWDYTSGTAYSGTGTYGNTENTLVIRGESGSSDHSIVTISGETAYYVRTVNTQNTNFGFYLLNLDFSGFDSSTSSLVTYSFKILANDTNNAINPNNWTVLYAPGSVASVGSAYFQDNVVKTFDFQDDNTTWTTVSGSFIVEDGSTTGAILINAGTSGSGYTSAGGYYLADLNVEVTAVPEPATTALCGGIFILAALALRRRFSARSSKKAV
ncbi:hypothetical protein H5P28_17025 [Ruficoccus amylovorans]|uniref:Uncharacterized protein n=1 Tax=Ruficoccus amylovorans TaxID=1804625 RepID=A0A842HLG3_9BACT|nr:hypothetical protein [Ruficoccus amylovorans]MBC2595971.1 hypothetical protein [Ruficoccus amylovorans]